jgi:aspartyl-tRNA(Asn)/glutamyl-tRNA(Gln) amidotransferase subunit C
MSEDTSKINVSYVAHLARMNLTIEEQTKFEGQLKDILAYVAKLNELDVTGVEPMAHTIPLSNVWREDKAQPSIERDLVLRNAPEESRGLFIVPKIVE